MALGYALTSHRFEMENSRTLHVVMRFNLNKVLDIMTDTGNTLPIIDLEVWCEHHLPVLFSGESRKISKKLPWPL